MITAAGYLQLARIEKNQPFANQNQVLIAALEDAADLMDAAEDMERLRLCERRLAAMTLWLQDNQPDVFRRGLWDAINEANSSSDP